MRRDQEWGVSRSNRRIAKAKSAYQIQIRIARIQDAGNRMSRLLLGCTFVVVLVELCAYCSLLPVFVAQKRHSLQEKYI
jgi:hypothetical protein